MDNDKLAGLSKDVELAERDKLRAVFPQCFTDGRLDVHKLLNLCGEYVDDGFEKYEFRWKGKTDCFRLAAKRSTGTLLPCPQESVNWNGTRNLYIEGDNLEVLKLLQTSYFRKVKMIYIDPPYNTGNDFVYADHFADPISRYREVTQQATKSNPETMGRFHTNWLNMMYPRLRLAANLLRDDGVIFISIDDGEVRNLRHLCDEVFGEENFEGHIHWRRRHNQPNDRTKMIALVAEHILVYAKSSDSLRAAGVGKVDLTGNFSNPDDDPRGAWASKPWKVGSNQSGSRYLIAAPSGAVFDEEWMGEEATYRELVADNRIIFPRRGDGMPRKKYFLSERQEEGQCATNWWDSTQFGSNQRANDLMTGLFGAKNVFSNPKPVELLRACIQIANAGSDDIILDFFSGSATTAHAVMLLNAEDGGHRRFIMVQLPEVCDDRSEAARSGYSTICEIGKERIRRAGAKLMSVRDEQLMLDNQAQAAIDVGFRVFTLDSSNMKAWDTKPCTGDDAATLVEQRLMDYLDVLVPGRTETDATYEVMLKLGQDLSDHVFDIELPGHRTVAGVGVPVRLIVCLAPGITMQDVEIMADYQPTWIVFAEQCFDNSTSKAVVWMTLRDRGIGVRAL